MKCSLLLLLALLSLPALAGEQDDAFVRRLFRVQFDQHLSSEPSEVDPGAKLSVEGCVSAIEQLRPGAVSVFAVGHEGWARVFNTTIEPHPALQRDTLAIWRQACDRTNTPLYLYVSSLINNRLTQRNTDFARQLFNGDHLPHRVDHNSPYVDDVLIPFVEEITRRYRPDGIWFDGDFWTLSPSWHPRSVQAFRQETGLSAPRDFGDERMVAFWKSTLSTHERYMRRVAARIHAIDPQVTFIVNTAGTLRHPIAIPEYLGRLNQDPPLFFGMTTACLEARFLSGRGDKPFDLVLGDYAEPEGIGYGSPKPRIQLHQEMATVLANGGGIKVYTQLSADGSFDVERLKALREVLTSVCLPRRAVLEQPSRSVPSIAVLHSGEHWDRTHRLDEVNGAALAMLRSGLHFDIVDSNTFVQRASDYKLAIVAEQGELGDEVIGALKAMLARGGGVVMSMPSGLSATSARERVTTGILPVQQAARELLPFDRARWTGEARIQTPGGPIGVPELYAPLLPPGSSASTDLPTDDGRVLRVRTGDAGRLVVLSAPVFRMFGFGQDPRLRAVLVDSVNWAAGDAVLSRVSGPVWVEMVHRRSASTDIVHLVNHARGRELRPRAPAVEDVPTARNLVVELPLRSRPLSVHAVPDTGPVQWTHTDGRLRVSVPQVDIFNSLLITHDGETGGGDPAADHRDVHGGDR